MTLTLIIIGWLFIGAVSLIWANYLCNKDVELKALIFFSTTGLIMLCVAITLWLDETEGITIIKWKKK